MVGSIAVNEPCHEVANGGLLVGFCLFLGRLLAFVGCFTLGLGFGVQLVAYRRRSSSGCSAAMRSTIRASDVPQLLLRTLYSGM